MKIGGYFCIVLTLTGLVVKPEIASNFRSSQKNILRFAYNAGAFSDVRLKDAELALEVWSESLRKKMAYVTEQVTAVILDGVADLEKVLLRGEVDVVILGPLEYFELEKKNLLDPVLVPFSGEKVTQKYLLLARDDRIQRVTQVKDKKALVQTGGQGPLPMIWLERLLTQKGFSEGVRIFSELSEVDKASQALFPVFFGQADVCVVTDRSYLTMTELNPQIARDLALLQSSEDLLRGLVCFRKDVPYEQRKEILKIMTEFHKEPEGNQILMIFHEEQLVPFESEYLNSARDLYFGLRKIETKTEIKSNTGK